MSNMTTMIVSIVVVLTAYTTVLSQEAGYFEPFEDEIPKHFTASRADSLSFCPGYYKHGVASLRWDWRASDR
jgi:hypothetical protein